ncbi:9683_t:CDS:1, partial [Acaulospora morrowiae]
MSLWTYSKNNQHYLANTSEEIIEQLQARPEANTTPTVMINNNLSGKDTTQLNVNMIEDIKQLIANICPFPIIDLTTKDNLVLIENKKINLALHSVHNRPINILLTIIRLLAAIKEQTYITINIPFVLLLDIPSYLNQRIKVSYSHLINCINELCTTKEIRLILCKQTSTLVFQESDNIISIDNILA